MWFQIFIDLEMSWVLKTSIVNFDSIVNENEYTVMTGISHRVIDSTLEPSQTDLSWVSRNSANFMRQSADSICLLNAKVNVILRYHDYWSMAENDVNFRSLWTEQVSRLPHKSSHSTSQVRLTRFKFTKTTWDCLSWVSVSHVISVMTNTHFHSRQGSISELGSLDYCRRGRLLMEEETDCILGYTSK